MFRTTTTLLPHQIPAVAKMLPIRVGALFMDMGTGKSRTLLEIAALRQDRWDRLFWFTPCSLRQNVLHQILEHTDIPETAVCLWDQKTMRRGVNRDAIVHVVGIESMGGSDRVAAEFADMVTEKSFVAVDESSYIKGSMAKRTQRITVLSEICKYRMLLTGTPFSQGVVDLYSQMKFLSPKILGYKSFYSFAKNHLEYETRKVRVGGRAGRDRDDTRTIRTSRIVDSYNTEYLAERIAPYVYQVRKDECLDLPDKLYETVWFSLTGEQEDCIGRAKEEFLADEYGDEQSWSPVRIFQFFGKLQTIVCGFLKTGEDRYARLVNRRIETLIDVLEGIPPDEKVLVWAKYHFCVDEICENLAEKYGADSVRAYHGGIPEKIREQSLRQWRGDRNTRFLVLTQSLGSHGLTLTEAAYAIFYADSFKYSERAQAEDRIHRIGQTRRPTYITILSESNIERRIDQALREKGNVLEIFRDEVQRFRDRGLRQNILELVKSL